MYLNHYELEKLMEIRAKEALEDARLDALAREIRRNKPNVWRRLAYKLGEAMIGLGQKLANCQGKGYENIDLVYDHFYSP